MAAPAVVVDLQDGFRGERVRVRLDDAEVFAAPDVCTDPATGLAARFSITVPDRRCVLVVELPDRRVVQHVPLVIETDPAHVGLALDEAGDVYHVIAARPFAYR